MIGRRAADLRDGVVDGGELDAAALAGLADQMAISLPLAARERDLLARVLGVPARLALRWTQDTIGMLRSAREHGVDMRVAAARLDALAWAWGDVPSDWSAADEQKVLRRWAAELERAGQ